MASKKEIEELKKLAKNHADIIIGGNRPWDIQIHDKIVFDHLITGDTLLLGEDYMDKKWDCDEIDVMINKLLSSDLIASSKGNWRIALYFLKAKIFNYANKDRSFIVGQKHYDIGNELYKNMLDKRMVYTCGYWKETNNLDQAQENKLDLICRKIGLKKNQKVLDIGGGWGSFAKYAAEKFDAKIVNTTISKEQVKLANELCNDLPVENRLQDYRDTNELFDNIVSVGMFEHVGYKNYREYFEVAAKNLKDDGLFLLHTIGGKNSLVAGDPWIEKYIFPNSMIPSLPQITKAIEGLFIIEDIHNFGSDYDKTLMAWYKNFIKNWDTISKDLRYDERFFRMWKLYLLSCAGSFRNRQLELWQIVLSKKGVHGGYTSIR